MIGQQPCRNGEGNWFPLPDGTLLAMMEDNFGIPGCLESPASPWRQTALVGRQTLPVFAEMVGEVSGALWVALYLPDYSERIWLSVGHRADLVGRIDFGANVGVLDAEFPFLLVRSRGAYGLTSLHLLRLGVDDGV